MLLFVTRLFQYLWIDFHRSYHVWFFSSSTSFLPMFWKIYKNATTLIVQWMGHFKSVTLFCITRLPKQYDPTQCRKVYQYINNITEMYHITYLLVLRYMHDPFFSSQNYLFYIWSHHRNALCGLTFSLIFMYNAKWFLMKYIEATAWNQCVKSRS